VDIYNISGQVVRSFSVSEGLHTLNWDGRDTNGKACGSGIYFYKLSTPSLSQTPRFPPGLFLGDFPSVEIWNIEKMIEL